jgi:hypothetical protein
MLCILLKKLMILTGGVGLGGNFQSTLSHHIQQKQQQLTVFFSLLVGRRWPERPL